MKTLLDLPKGKKPLAAMTLAHGAGAGMEHVFLADLAAALAKAGVAVLRFQFPYMEKGSRRPDPPAVATAAVAEAVALLREKVQGAPVFAAGKSFGARMSTTAAAEGKLEGVAGIVCFGFPLHPAGEPSIKRAEHLAKVKVPMLFLQGTRDELAELELMQGVCGKLERARLHVVEGADHGFDVLKRSGRTRDEVLAELVTIAATSMASRIKDE